MLTVDKCNDFTEIGVMLCPEANICKSEFVLQVSSHEGHHVYGVPVQKTSRSCDSVPASGQGGGSVCWSLVGVYAFR